jgi:hypothetical protein
MTVKGLIKLLKTVDENKRVYLASDEEGNSFSTINSDSLDEQDKYIVIFPFEEYTNPY